MFKKLTRAKTEEAVKAVFVHEFKLTFNSEDRIDLFVPPVLFEFKLDLNLNRQWPQVLAQALYYVRGIRDESARPMPTWVAIIDKNEGALSPVETWADLFDGDYDWDRAPSSPCPKLVESITTRNGVRILDFTHELSVFCEQLTEALADQTILCRPITAHNFEQTYHAWEKALGIEGQNLGALFVADCCLDVWFDPLTGELTAKSGKVQSIQVPVMAYQAFWATYRRPPTVDAQREITGRRDRLRAIQTRRVEGEFFTPPLFCEKACDYLTLALGANWQDEYVVWDPCAGTGNLLWPLRVSGARVFASSLHKEDVASINWYEGATVFQFDFLNDPVEKLPEGLREALKHDKVLFLMNPPYAEATSGGTTTKHKTGVKATKVSQELTDIDLGKAANELFVQFFWRCQQLCEQASVALFATLKYINAPAFQKFRDRVLSSYAFKSGFVFPAAAFQGTAGSWPVSFAVWSPESPEHSCNFNVYNKEGGKIGGKTVAPRTEYLNGWFTRPRGTVPAVPLIGALAVRVGNARLEKLAENSVGYAAMDSNTPQKSNGVFLLSHAYWGGNGSSITPEIFERVMTVVAVRKAIQPTWLNDRDQFQIPHTEPSLEFVAACVVFNLFSGHNQTSEFTAEYKDKKWPIRNPFFPFDASSVKAWGPQTLAFQRNVPTNTFVYQWLCEHSAVFNSETQAVLEAATGYYQLFFQNYLNVNRTKWKIEGANPGFYQIRMALKEAGIGLTEYAGLTETVKRLQTWIIPRVYTLGFLEPERNL